MIDRVSDSHCGLLAATGFPRETDARLEGALVKLDACPLARALPGNQELRGRGIEVRLTVARFRNRGRQIPGQSQIQRQVLPHSPIVLNVGTEDFPSPSGHIALEGLVVNCQARQAQEKVGLRIVGPQARHDPVAILETLGSNIHLIRTDRAADFYVVLATNYVQSVVHGIDVRAAREGGETAISECPVAAIELG